MRNNMKPAEFASRDIYLATVLKQAGIPIIRIENYTGRAVFVFKASGEIEAITAKYFNGELRLDPQSLFGTWKSLKSQAFSAIGDVR